MEKRTRQGCKEGILRALIRVQQHLDDELPLAELASAAHFSPWPQ